MRRIKKLEGALMELRGEYSKLAHKIDNPPKFKKGDKVRWIKYCKVISSGIVNSYKMDVSDAYNGWKAYKWLYKIIDGAEIRNIYEEFLEHDTPGK